MIKYGKMTLELCDGAYYVCDCEKDAARIVIPPYIDEIAVMGIRDNAFEGCKSLEVVRFPEHDFDELEPLCGFEIGDMAFYGCISLCEIYLPESVMSVGRSAFLNCSSLKRVVHSDSFFAPYAFAHCETLEQISPLTYISEGVFSHCASLAVFPITDDTTEISEDAFEHCDSLTDVIVPAKVSRIEALAFRGCAKLASVCFENPCGWYVSNSYFDDDELLDLSDPEKNAQMLSRMDFDDGVLFWYKK